MAATTVSVGLGTLRSVDGQHIEVAASSYNADSLTLYVVDDQGEVELDLDRRQMQELSIIIDRFLDK